MFLYINNVLINLIVILKKIYLMYSSEKNGKQIFNFTNLLSFAKDFHLFKQINSFSQTNLQIIYSKLASNSKNMDLQNFIEALFRISKLVIKKNVNDMDLAFKEWIESYLVRRYKQINLVCFEFNVENIQVFNKIQNNIENPVVGLLVEIDELLRHVSLNIFTFVLYKYVYLGLMNKNF